MDYSRSVDESAGERVIADRRIGRGTFLLLLSILLVLIPLLWLMAAVGEQAAEISTTVGPWIEEQIENPTDILQSLEGIPGVARLAPYEDQILAKVGRLGASAAG